MFLVVGTVLQLWGSFLSQIRGAFRSLYLTTNSGPLGVFFRDVVP